MQDATGTAPRWRVRASGSLLAAAAVVGLALAGLSAAFALGKRAGERGAEARATEEELPFTMNWDGRFIVEGLEGEAILVTDQERDCAYLVSGPTVRALDEGACKARPAAPPASTPPSLARPRPPRSSSS